MKKRLLFVMNNLGCGGAEKSLITLLNCIDYSKYEVDLFLFDQTGLFIDLLPEEVNMLPSSKYWAILNSPFANSVKALGRDFRLDLIWTRIFQAIACRRYKNHALAEQKMWKFIRYAFRPIEGEYNAVIGFLEKNPIYFSIDRVRAKKKIGWIHSSYRSLKIDTKAEKEYFDKLDYIVTVSKESAKELKSLFPANSSKVTIINNIISPNMIKSLANNPIEMNDNKCIKIVTVSRLDFIKGIDLAIEACSMLKNEGYRFEWHVIGDGRQKDNLQEKIRQLEVGNYFFLEGQKLNPYPYMKAADIYVQPSRSEAFGIAVAEARTLCKPIIVTSYPAAAEQISNGIDGLIVEISAEGLYKGLKYLIDNGCIRAKFTSALAKSRTGNEEEIHKFYRIIEG